MCWKFAPSKAHSELAGPLRGRAEWAILRGELLGHQVCPGKEQCSCPGDLVSLSDFLYCDVVSSF